MSGRLSGNAVLVTGASAGIGWASAIALAREGANLVVTARRKDRLVALARECEAAGVRVATLVGDACEEATAVEAVAVARSGSGLL